jgi:hypothetical protein
MKEFLDSVEKWATIYVQDKFENSCARMEMVRDGLGCTCRNCTTEAVNNLNSYLYLIFTDDSMDDCLLFKINKDGVIVVPKWYDMYTDALKEGKKHGDRK